MKKCVVFSKSLYFILKSFHKESFLQISEDVSADKRGRPTTASSKIKVNKIIFVRPMNSLSEGT